ncbi:MAG TPA: hypothetical protein VER98_12830, partial [Terriglobia bacterium]|nr:hypothetical protein [Terriglobia bacterium]
FPFIACYDWRMKTRPRPRTKAEDVPAPNRAEFEGVLRKLVSVPKSELERREARYQRLRKKNTK